MKRQCLKSDFCAPKAEKNEHQGSYFCKRNYLPSIFIFSFSYFCFDVVAYTNNVEYEKLPMILDAR